MLQLVRRLPFSFFTMLLVATYQLILAVFDFFSSRKVIFLPFLSVNRLFGARRINWDGPVPFSKSDPTYQLDPSEDQESGIFCPSMRVTKSMKRRILQTRRQKRSLIYHESSRHNGERKCVVRACGV